MCQELRIDILTCALLKHIVWNNINKSNLLEHCENSNNLKNSTAAPTVLTTSILTQVRDCKVVLEDISLSSGATKLEMLDPTQDEIHRLIHITS